MKIHANTPPRLFDPTGKGSYRIADCGRIELAADEQVTFVTESGGEYDVARKSWGFYATPSLNSRLPHFGLRAALVENRQGGLYVMLQERGKEAEFQAYLTGDGLRVVAWLDDPAATRAIVAKLDGAA